MEWLAPSLRRRCPTKSRRLTDTLNLYRELFNECISERDLLTKLLVWENHFMQCIPEHFTAIFKVITFGNNLRPLHQLTHVS
ncbi:hypothetical protein TRIP_B350202 [uncultured Desulfatiglans sp.]|uniref:Uncharacterized protein n=1 Tax=Uncultured Desulfatiglans sp. TaxID=1748965 RepID=A0A653AAS9_UNCDX|nr:hypothetical protein TRIP_B350202 [uncultured Desulfatiglans sp.]